MSVFKYVITLVVALYFSNVSRHVLQSLPRTHGTRLMADWTTSTCTISLLSWSMKTLCLSGRMTSSNGGISKYYGCLDSIWFFVHREIFRNEHGQEGITSTMGGDSDSMPRLSMMKQLQAQKKENIEPTHTITRSTSPMLDPIFMAAESTLSVSLAPLASVTLSASSAPNVTHGPSAPTTSGSICEFIVLPTLLLATSLCQPWTYKHIYLKPPLPVNSAHSQTVRTFCHSHLSPWISLKSHLKRSRERSVQSIQRKTVQLVGLVSSGPGVAASKGVWFIQPLQIVWLTFKIAFHCRLSHTLSVCLLLSLVFHNITIQSQIQHIIHVAWSWGGWDGSARHHIGSVYLVHNVHNILLVPASDEQYILLFYTSQIVMCW